METELQRIELIQVQCAKVITFFLFLKHRDILRALGELETVENL